jgi:hypothetical protein
MGHAAFAAGLGLWAAFLLADEAFVAYALGGTHLRLFTAQMATLLAEAAAGVPTPVRKAAGE